jgi:hypothetical protein
VLLPEQKTALNNRMNHSDIAFSEHVVEKSLVKSAFLCPYSVFSSADPSPGSDLPGSPRNPPTVTLPISQAPTIEIPGNLIPDRLQLTISLRASAKILTESLATPVLAH